MRKIILSTCLALYLIPAIAQNTFWKDEIESSVPKLNTPKWISPQQFRMLSLNFEGYKNFLSQSPKEFTTGSTGLIISLPFPDNSFQQFRIVETKMMEEGLAAQLPGIKTFTGQGIDDPYATVRIDYTYQGFHAFIMSVNGNVFIDPYERLNNDLYISYFSKDYTNAQKQFFKCDAAQNLSPNNVLTGTCIGTQLKTYRLALACTGEYAVAVCAPSAATVLGTASAMITSVNRVVGVYEKELAIRMILVANNNNLINLNAATDPYTNNNGSTMLGENISTVNTIIGAANYDIGHVFSTGGGGVAYLGVVCNNSYKAGGVTGSPSPVGDDYDIDYVAHEMGHQFGADHTFESKTGACGGGNRNGSTAYEVGSGTTIMAYAGICGSDDIQPHSDPYFHTVSFDQIIAYVNAGGLACAIVTATGNNPPNITMPANNLKIPNNTPFVLNANATDPDGDALTFNWEQWDLSQGGNGSDWNAGAGSTSKPLFKSRIPKTTGERYFPSLAFILAGYPANPPAVMDGLKGETMTTTSRDIKFRLTVRDNRAGGGGVSTAGDGCNSTAIFKVTTTSDGPFVVTNPNTAVIWAVNSSPTVTWNVANTNSVAGINTQLVDIFLSTDGGITYPITILTNTPNDGSEMITVPNIASSTTARIMIKAVGNIFFDISDVDFTITSVVPVNLITFNVQSAKDALQLNWVTSQEINNKGFDVQRSEGNTSAFLSIAFINSDGNSITTKKYTLSDRNIKKGTDYFYRIRQVDFNGNAAFSSTERGKINEDGIMQMLVTPNPVANTVHIALNGIAKEPFTIIITDMSGKVFSRRGYNNTSYAQMLGIDVPELANGLYMIRLLQNNNIITQKFLKQ